MLELRPGGELGSRVVAGEPGHRPAEHARGDLARRDLGEARGGPVPVDVLDEAADDGLAGEALTPEARGDRGERERVVHRQGMAASMASATGR
ncbi:hypothetical protein [Streptomyces eurythermus]|uniref:hypothetical protein n=1 Tax=Streptomyces eurythermus TaxID=42237 RepID=UPI0036F70A8B